MKTSIFPTPQPHPSLQEPVRTTEYEAGYTAGVQAAITAARTSYHIEDAVRAMQALIPRRGTR